MARVLGFLVSRWFLTLLLTLALCAAVWVWGPLLTVGESAVLASDVVRLVVAQALLVVWGVYNIVHAGRARGRAAAEAPAAPAPERRAPPAVPGPDPDERRAIERETGFLRREFRRAMTVLRRSSRGFVLGGAWRYELPWYLVLGTGGAGKSALIASSGLSLPFGDPTELPPGRERSSIWAERIGFWFADDAVLIEPPGDLVAAAAEQVVPGGVWRAFLDQIRRSRPRQPLNGIVLTIALPDLVSMDENETRAFANRIRAQLRDTRDRLRLRLPVYLVFTMADRLAGFTEYFDAFPAEDRAQVLGITLPLAAETEGSSPLAALEPQVEALLESLNRRVLDRMHREPDLGRRGLAFGFPQQLALAQVPIRTFLEALFRVSRYEERPLARGVYFTSALQGGTAIDLVQRAVADLVPGRAAPAVAAGQRSYFVSGVFSGVLLRDGDLAGTDPRFERRRRLAFAAVALLAIGATAWAILSWRDNLTDSRGLLAGFRGAVAAADAEGVALMPVPDAGSGGAALVTDTDFAGAEPPLSRLRAMRDEIATTLDARPWRTALGLYPADDIRAAAQAAYDNALEAVLMPRLLLLLEQRLADPALDERQVYALLRVYLMLGREGPLDAAAVRGAFGQEWQRLYPDREALALRDALDRHLERLLGTRYATPALDASVVAGARDRLAATEDGERGFALMQQLPEVQRLPAWRVVDQTGPLGPRVLERRSGATLQDGIAGLFTADAFRSVGRPAALRVAQFLAREGWVMGRPTDPLSLAAATLRIEDAVLQVYAEAYAREWELLLADVRIVPFPDVPQAADGMSILGGAASPLRRFLLAAQAETDLLAGLPDPAPDAPPSPGGAAGALAAAASDIAAAAGLGGNGADRGPEERVTARFAALREMVGPAGDAPALTGLIEAFAEAGRVFTQYVHSPDPEESILAVLDGSASNAVPVAAALAQIATTLPEPHSGIVRDLADTLQAVASRGARDLMNAVWQDEILPMCNTVTVARYPFVPSAADEIPLDDFAAVFAPGALLDGFFTDRLASLVDRRRSPWTWRAGTDEASGFDPATPAFFQRVDAIQSALFPDGAAVPTVRFLLRPRTLDAAVDRVVVEINGQRLAYAHGVREAQQMEWVAAPDARVRVFFSPPLAGQQNEGIANGPWALQRFLRGVDVFSTEVPERLDVEVRLGDRVATFDLIHTSVANPLASDLLAGLRCPERL